MARIKTLSELTALLEKNVVHFKYVKKGGEDRVAYGTLNEKYIPASEHGKISNDSTAEVFRFFDVENQGVRSMMATASFEVIDTVPVNV